VLPTCVFARDFAINSADGNDIVRFHSADVIGYQVAASSTPSDDHVSDQPKLPKLTRSGRSRVPAQVYCGAFR
jgi:hypothetical protein